MSTDPTAEPGTALTAAINLEYVRNLAQAEAADGVNFYAGEAPGGITGEIRIEFQGRIYTARFGLSADHGNQGREGPRQEQFWTAIDLPGVLGLR